MSNSMKLATFGAIVLMAIIFNRPCLASKSGNLEYWQAQSVTHSLSDTYKISVEQEFRVGRQCGSNFLHNVNVALTRTGITDWLDIGFAFKKEYEKDSSGKFREEDRPQLNFFFKGTMYDLPLSNRFRIEYRDHEIKSNVFRVRNKFGFKLPYELTPLKLEPYIADEVFFNLNSEDFNQNRLYSGLSFKPLENMVFSFYYMYKKSKSSRGWTDTNVIGTQLKFLF
ncbi:MAG: DUF2490 domain-containing protein [Planctomycetota bacterium]|jgi:hypothetical protein